MREEEEDAEVIVEPGQKRTIIFDADCVVVNPSKHLPSITFFACFVRSIYERYSSHDKIPPLTIIILIKKTYGGHQYRFLRTPTTRYGIDEEALHHQMKSILSNVLKTLKTPIKMAFTTDYYTTNAEGAPDTILKYPPNTVFIGSPSQVLKLFKKEGHPTFSPAFGRRLHPDDTRRVNSKLKVHTQNQGNDIHFYLDIDYTLLNPEATETEKRTVLYSHVVQKIREVKTNFPNATFSVLTSRKFTEEKERAEPSHPQYSQSIRAVLDQLKQKTELDINPTDCATNASEDRAYSCILTGGEIPKLQAMQKDLRSRNRSFGVLFDDSPHELNPIFKEGDPGIDGIRVLPCFTFPDKLCSTVVALLAQIPVIETEIEEALQAPSPR